jgi:hypothetical protein
MAIREFAVPHPHAAYPEAPKSFAALPPANSQAKRAVSIAAARPGMRKSRVTRKLPSSCTWYEAEDRNLPSVSSF